MDNFYTAKEAQKKLGVTHDKFQYMVRSGKIKKVILPDRKYGVYPKEQINRLAAAIEAATELYTHEASTFERATESDLPEIYTMVKGTGLIPTPIEIMKGWIQHNPESFYTLRDEGIVVAYACILAVDHDWLMRVLKDEIRIGRVPLEQISLFVPGQPLDIYIRDLVVGKGQRDKVVHYAQRIIAELVNIFSQLGERGVEIRAAYAFATSPQGNNICQRLHFTALTEFNPQIKGHMPYKLDIATASSPLIDLYKKSLEQYQAHHSGEQE
jgi:hypothetical protein